MTIYLVRHAKAGERGAWDGEDTLRPLTAQGHRQARALLDVLADARFERVLSSPYVRCMETVVPLAAERKLAVEPVDALAEGADLDDVLSLVHKHAPGGVVFSTHGDIVPMLLDYVASRGVDIGPTPQWPKASTWVLETDDTGEITEARYLGLPPN
ncbi:MAG TPA: phosphoglycerate mutase family protein [Acidimicrobiia bacterium]|nr:phosphoglycerate mutase family protein [Acidimicrobiia bacterium]